MSDSQSALKPGTPRRRWLNATIGILLVTGVGMISPAGRPYVGRRGAASHTARVNVLSESRNGAASAVRPEGSRYEASEGRAPVAAHPVLEADAPKPAEILSAHRFRSPPV